MKGLLWLLLGSVLAGSSLCSAKTFPRYRQLIEQQEESTPSNEDLEEEYAERRVLAEQYYSSRPSRSTGEPHLCSHAPSAGLAAKKATPPLKALSNPQPQGCPDQANGPNTNLEPIICGNDTTSFTVTISGTATNTTCTVSESLSDNGADPCKKNGKVYGEDCDIYLGGLYVNVGFVNPAGTANPNVQAGLDFLGFGNLSQVGLFHLSIGGAGQQVLAPVDFLPNLQAVIGAANPNPANGFTGAALYLAGSTGQDITSLPSLDRLTNINGTTILQDLALVNLTSGLQELQVVEGDLVVESNPSLTSMAGTAQSLTTVMGQVYIANNPMLVSLAGDNTSTAAPGTGTLKTVGKQLTIGGNAELTSLAGLESLEYVGGTITISQNTMLSDISALSRYANCASNPTSQGTPVSIFVEIVVNIQAGAPPITCILNNFVAICAYIKEGGCPNPNGTQAIIASAGSELGD